MAINWEEFKIYKKEMPHLNGDNFDKLLYFTKSFYNISSVGMLYNLLSSDETAKMMLDKRGINSVVKLDEYMSK